MSVLIRHTTVIQMQYVKTLLAALSVFASMDTQEMASSALVCTFLLSKSHYLVQ